MAFSGLVLLLLLELAVVHAGVEQNRIPDTDLHTLVRQLASRVEQLESKDKQHEKQADTAQGEIIRLKRELVEQREITAQMVTLLDEQKQELHSLEKTVSNLQGDHLQQQDKSQSRTRRQENEVTVGFYADLSISHVHILGYQDIVFDHVVVNVGGAYNNAHGVFTAPTGGLYVFSTTLMTESRNDTHCAITINAKPITSMKLFGSEHMYDTTSQTVVYDLQKGDTVSITHTEYGKALHGLYSTFSGFLLQQDFSAPTIVG